MKLRGMSFIIFARDPCVAAGTCRRRGDLEDSGAGSSGQPGYILVQRFLSFHLTGAGVSYNHHRLPAG
jgi:hypothetical protein